MSIPFMPHPLIIPTFDLIQMPTNVENSDKIKLEKLKKYFKRRWTIRISPGEAKHCNQQRSRKLPFKTQNQHTCSQRIQDLGQSCPICRSNMEYRHNVTRRNVTRHNVTDRMLLGQNVKGHTNK